MQVPFGGSSLFKALLSSGLLGGAAVVVITASVAPAKAHDHELGFISAVGFNWNLDNTVTVSYGPTIGFSGFVINPATSIDINLVTLNATNLRLFGSFSYPIYGSNVSAAFDIPITDYSSDPASWSLGLHLPIDQDGLTGSVDLKTTGLFSEGAFSDAASNARIGITLDVPGGFELATEIGFSERDSFDIKNLSIGQELMLNGQSFRLGLDVPTAFFLSGAQAGNPPLGPSIPDLDYLEPEGFFHTPGTGYVYTGRGLLGPTQEFGLTSTNVPGPLPILGIGAAFSFSRKLRKRIKNAKPEVISVTSI